MNLDQINENISCPYVYSPVCGCNGTYNNECEAFFCGGVTEWSDGPCEGSTEDCDPLNGTLTLTECLLLKLWLEGTELSWWVNGNEIGNGENYIEYNMSNLLEPVDICVGGEQKIVVALSTAKQIPNN